MAGARMWMQQSSVRGAVRSVGSMSAACVRASVPSAMARLERAASSAAARTAARWVASSSSARGGDAAFDEGAGALELGLGVAQVLLGLT